MMVLGVPGVMIKVTNTKMGKMFSDQSLLFKKGLRDKMVYCILTYFKLHKYWHLWSWSLLCTHVLTMYRNSFYVVTLVRKDILR